MITDASSDFQINNVPRISVIGVGGAGVNAVNNMILSQLDGVRFIVANTDCQSLTNSLAETKIQLGAKCTKGLGAGSNPELGKQAGEEATDLIKREIADIDMLFIATGMGGGTGTGASPVVAKIAKDLGVLVVGVAIKPFELEGKKRMATANKGIAELEKFVDTLIVIENQKLMKLNNVSMFENYEIADSILRQAVYCVVSILNKQGFINRDFADIKTVLSNAGRAIIGYGEDIDPKIATDIAIHNQVLEDTSICGAKNILLNIAGNKNLKTADIEDVVEKVRDEAKSFDNEEPNVIFGIAFDEELGDNIRVSIIASGVEKIQSKKVDIKIDNSVSEKKRLRIDDNNKIDEQEIDEDINLIEENKIENPTFVEPIDEDELLENNESFNLKTEEIPDIDEKIIPFERYLLQNIEKRNGTRTTKKKNNINKQEQQSGGLFDEMMEEKKPGFLKKMFSSISPIPFADSVSSETDEHSNEETNAEDGDDDILKKLKISNG